MLLLALVLTGGVTGLGSSRRASATPTPRAGQPGATITIKDFKYDPAQLNVKVGQTITITNNDSFNHTVTAQDGSFNVDVPGNGSVTLTVPKAGTFPYSCTYHPGQHNPAAITAS